VSTVRLLLGLTVAGLILAVPFAYSSFRQKHFRNFRIVEEGVLYRSGQMTQSGLTRMLDEYRIKTVISLRYADDPTKELPPDHQEELFCRNRGVNYHRIRTQLWESNDGSAAPAWQNVNQFLKLMDDRSNYPVLVHCYAGMHRTGAHCAIYRMEYQGWSNHDAIEEMRRLGYENIDTEDDVRGFLEAYRRR
jgi:tyrosine-protein phosphatase SIW14